MSLHLGARRAVAEIARGMVQCSTGTAVLLALSTGLLLAVQIFGVPLLLGTDAFWSLPEGDSIQWMTAWHVFSQESWHVPLFHTSQIQAPAGISLVYMDPTPWFACLSKLLLPGGANPYGLWVITTFAMQGVASTLVLRQCGLRGAAHALGVTIIATNIQPFLVRWDLKHASLAAHFLVVLALWLYLRYREREPSAREGVAWAALLCLAALTHPYLFVMCAVIAGSALVRNLSSWRALATLGIQSALVGIASALVLYLAGYFPLPHHAKGRDPYFGPTAMNLLSPILPLDSGLIPWIHFGDHEPTGIGFDVAFYPGLVILALLAFVLVARRRAFWSTLCRHWPLLVACVPLIVYALTPSIRLGRSLVFQMHVPTRVAEVMSALRVTGRFFLPVCYMLVFLALGMGIASFRKQIGAMIILLLAVAQFAEATPQRASLRHAYSEPGVARLDAAAWAPLMNEHSGLVVLPSYQCIPGGREWESRALLSRELQFIAAKSKLAINGVYAARQLKDCQDDVTAMANMREHMREDTLYVLLSPYVSLAQIVELGSATCASFGYGFVCSARWARPSLAHVRERFGSIQDELAPTPIGTSLTFGTQGNGMRYLGRGWSWPEEGHVWSDEREAGIDLPRLPQGRPLLLSMKMSALLDEVAPEMRVDVVANGVVLDTWVFTSANNEKAQARRVMLLPSVVGASETLKLRLRISTPHQSPSVPDTRALGVDLSEVLLTYAAP